jgi:hypothetical protein
MKHKGMATKRRKNRALLSLLCLLAAYNQEPILRFAEYVGTGSEAWARNGSN